jgi:quercetin dioxygenase-like cupin family protein
MANELKSWQQGTRKNDAGELMTEVAMRLDESDVSAVTAYYANLDPNPEPKRAILERHDQAGVRGKEIVIGTVTLPPGAAVGAHQHPGDEAGYIVKGSVIWRARGQPDKTLMPGESFFNPRGAVHSIAAAQDSGAIVISTWVVDKGKPLVSAGTDEQREVNSQR